MPGRNLLFIGLLIVAVAGPYLVSEGGLLKTPADGGQPGAPFWKRWWGAATPATETQPVATLTPPPGAIHDAPENALGGAPLPTVVAAHRLPLPGRPVAAKQLAGPAGITLAEALRFDVSPNWVIQNWPRVTTQVSDVDYRGMRVPLVTGTDPDDVAGSLTYFFNAQGIAERITFVGTTGDFEPTGMYLQQLFGMQRYATTGPGIFLAFAGNQPASIMYVEDPGVQSDTHPRNRYRIEIELNAPRAGVALSQPWLDRLRRMRDAKAL
ncbi:MAG: hypothetical protein KDA92_07735 [Planctomycetales bacterium]|nr:hypothetical protein [Planctomycetales bacterium]MCA9169068.1 hypothetical protein [Planctomycetales bacterium]